MAFKPAKLEYEGVNRHFDVRARVCATSASRPSSWAVR